MILFSLTTFKNLFVVRLVLKINRVNLFFTTIGRSDSQFQWRIRVGNFSFSGESRLLHFNSYICMLRAPRNLFGLFSLHPPKSWVGGHFWACGCSCQKLPQRAGKQNVQCEPCQMIWYHSPKHVGHLQHEPVLLRTSSTFVHDTHATILSCEKTELELKT